jgi:SAM-dependent methyltransferase
MKTLLHVGCGPLTRMHMTPGFRTGDWHEVRLDIDPAVRPDIIGTMTDMSGVDSQSVDALYSAHNLEHVFPHEVPAVLAEFHRVLKPNGFVVLTCPDLLSVCAAVADDRLLEPLYESSMGPISPIDILFGHRTSMEQGRHYMAHKCGFTYKTLCSSFEEAGFGGSVGGARPQFFDLWLLAYKNDTELSQEFRMQQAALYLP